MGKPKVYINTCPHDGGTFVICGMGFDNYSIHCEKCGRYQGIVHCEDKSQLKQACEKLWYQMLNDLSD